jgi:hypothetical protein
LSDQLLAGGRQFLYLFLAARFLDRASFAPIAILSATALVIVQISNYAIRIPMLVYSGTVFEADRNTYWRLLRAIDVTLSAAAALLAALAVSAASNYRMANLIPVFVLAGVSANLLELERRFCYIRFRPRSALAASLAALLCTVIPLVLLGHSARLTPSRALAILGAAQCAGLLVCFRPLAGHSAPSRSRLCWRVYQAHRDYARWELLGGVLLWLATSGLLVIYQKAYTEEQVGSFRLAMSLCGLVVFPVAVAENSLTTHVAAVLRDQGPAAFRGLLHRFHRYALFLVPCYAVLAGSACALSIALLFGSKYPSMRSMAVPAFLFTALGLEAAVRNIGLRSMAKPRFVCAAEAARAAVALASSLVLLAMGRPAMMPWCLVTGALAFRITQRHHWGRSALAV